MRANIIKPLAIVILSAGVLSTDATAEAAAFRACNTWTNGPCNGWDQEQYHIACNFVCPTWYIYICDGDSGQFMCVNDPS